MARLLTVWIEQELASFYLSQLRKMLKPLNERLSLLMPSAETKVPPPKLTPAFWAAIHGLVADILANPADTLKDFHALFEIKEPLSDFVNKTLPTLAKTTSLADLDLNAVDALVAIMIDADLTVTAVKKVIPKVSKYRGKLKEFAQRTKDYAGGPGSSERQKRDLEEYHLVMDKVTKLDHLVEFYESIPYVKPNGASTREWTIAINTTGLPKSYPTDIVKDGTYTRVNVKLMITKRDKTFAGRWWGSPHGDVLGLIELVAQYTEQPPSEDEFKALKDHITETIQHELRHMVQTVMHYSLRRRKSTEPDASKKPPATLSRRAGTVFSPREHLPDSPENKAEKAAYPRATDKELYYLDPVEFFPQIGSAVAWFLEAYSIGTWTEVDVARSRWKGFTGISPQNIAGDPSPFYLALQKNDKRLWKRAVAEGWQMVERALYKKEPSAEELAKGIKMAVIDFVHGRYDAANWTSPQKAWATYVGIRPAETAGFSSTYYLWLKKHSKQLWRKAVDEGWKAVSKELQKREQRMAASA